MGTYDHKQVLVDYEKGKITPEMATGHSLQHIDNLYDALKTSRQEWQTKFDALDQRVNRNEFSQPKPVIVGAAPLRLPFLNLKFHYKRRLIT